MSKFKRWALAAIVAQALVAPPALADVAPDRVSILLGSSHINAQHDFNEQNLGAFATWERDSFHWSVGVYENSFNRTSIAAIAYLPVIEWDRGDAGLFAGAALYPQTGRHQTVSVGDVVPVGGIQVRQGHAFVQIMPTFGYGADAVVSFGLTFAINSN